MGRPSAVAWVCAVLRESKKWALKTPNSICHPIHRSLRRAIVQSSATSNRHGPAHLYIVRPTGFFSVQFFLVLFGFLLFLFYFLFLFSFQFLFLLFIYIFCRSPNDAFVCFFLQYLADILPKESIVWKLKMLRTAASYVNSRLHAVKAQTLVVARYDLQQSH